MKKLSLFFVLIFLLISSITFSQDERQVFTQEQLLWFVENYHPLAQQANLLASAGESTIRKAKGNFDPYLFSQFDQKYFDDKEYFSILGTGLKIPTWYGIEIKGGYDRNRGVFLNPENYLPSSGLWYAGVSVTLGKGLFIDERRATLQQAQIFAQSTLAEQQKLMNDLYFQAIKKYWKWVESWNQLQVFNESVDLARERYNAVKESFTYGDIPAIDTLEAFIQLQNRQLNQNESELQYQNVSLELSNFLWFENNTPLEITDSLRPPTFFEISLLENIPPDTLQNFVEKLEIIHPDMQLYQLKLSSMDIDRRLKAEQLKPTININYNALNAPVGNDFLSNFSPQNYKWGLEFGIPLFLRKERGDLQLTKIKIQETELNQQQKLLELQNKVRQYHNQQLNLKNQVDLYTNAVANYDSLLEGEKQKFEAGESSLFLVNSRETNLINARLKLIKFTTEYNQTNAGILWAAGILYNQ